MKTIHQQIAFLVVLSVIGNKLTAQILPGSPEEELTRMLMESELIVDGCIREYESKYDSNGRIYTLMILDIDHIFFKEKPMQVHRKVTLFEWGGQIDNDNQILEHFHGFPFKVNALFFLTRPNIEEKSEQLAYFVATSPYVPCLRYDAEDFEGNPYYLWWLDAMVFRNYEDFIHAVRNTAVDKRLHFKKRRYHPCR